MKQRVVRLALIAGCLLVVLPVHGGGRAVAMDAPLANRSTPGVVLLSQSPFVNEKGVFNLRLRVIAQNPATDFLQVLAFQRLTTRTYFDNALQGNFNSTASYSFTVGVSKLQADPAGGVDVDIPVNEAAPAGSSVPTFNAIAQSGVFPIQIGLYDSSNRLEGQSLNTFLVYALPESATGLPRLSVAVILPLSSPLVLTTNNRVAPVPPDESSRLSGLVGALSSDSSVPYSLNVNPQTLGVLATGSTTDRATEQALPGAIQGAKAEVLPAGYAQVSLGDLEAAALDGEVSEQLKAGSASLDQVFGSVPSMSTWVTPGPLDSPTLSALTSRGATRFVVPDGDLTALPQYATVNTFAYPTRLDLAGAPKLTVYGADLGLTADFTRSASPVLAANQLLAELAMIQLETPGDVRGVVALPPPGWSASPSFVSTLLGGLAGHPLLAPVTASNLFAKVSQADVSRQLGPANAAAPLSPAAAALTNDAGSIRAARSQIAALASVLPADKAQVALLENQLLIAESTDLTEDQRQAMLSSISAAAGKVDHLISLPSSSSITLTSNHGQIPLTILSSPSLKVRVQLRLTSQRLIFQAFNSPAGRCQVPTPTTAVCDLLLSTQNTTLKVPVQTRSSGVFPLQVSLYSPDGSLQLAYDQDTVRSTAVSGVGIVLIVLAVLSLGLWWVRDVRHGRRARKLVPSPVELADEHPKTETVSEDPVVNAFFTKPAPEFHQHGER